MIRLIDLFDCLKKEVENPGNSLLLRMWDNHIERIVLM